MINKKKLIASVVIAAVACAVIISSVLAYFTARKSNDSSLLIGNCDVTIIEEFDPPPKYIPGDIINKKPWVKNVGNVPCYVRIRADLSDNLLADYLDIDFDSEEWSSKKEDGYYYYIGNAENGGILQPEEESAPLFTTVTISDIIPDDKIKNFEIFIYSEAVPAIGFDSPEEAWLKYVPQTL